MKMSVDICWRRIAVWVLPSVLFFSGCERWRKPVFTIAESGNVCCDIVLPANPSGAERYAAEELKYHLDKAFGAKWEIVGENRFNPSNYPYHFFIGRTKAAAAAGLPGRELKRDERVLKTGDGAFFLLGDDNGVRYENIGTKHTTRLGTLYAVYDFLETEMGVKWIWPGPTGEVVPRRQSLSLAAVDRSGAEPLKDRFWYGTQYPSGDLYGFTSKASAERFFQAQRKFLVRHRCGYSENIPRGHSFSRWWDRFGKEHPEYFNLLSDGKRRPFSKSWLVTMCVSQPGIWKQRVADWKVALNKIKRPLTVADLTINCSENDNAGLCRCDGCRAWDAPDERFAKAPYWNGTIKGEDLEEILRKDGAWGLSEFISDNRWTIPVHDPATDIVPSLSDRYAKFYNHVVAEARKIHPDAKVIGYAYENYLEAPKETKVDPSVIIEFVPRSYFPYDKEESEFFRKHFKGWRDAGTKEFSLRPNYTAGGNYVFDQAPAILEDFAFAYTNGMSSYALGSLRGSWAAHSLMQYSITRAFRDPLFGYEKSREELVSAFGRAQEPIRRYFSLILQNTTRFTFSEIRKMAADNFIRKFPGGSHSNATAIIGDMLNEGFIAELYAVLDEASALATDDTEVLARIDFLRKGLRDTELTRNTRLAQKAYHADLRNPEKKAAFKAAFKAMNDYRSHVEDEFICNYHIAARQELSGLGWPHENVVK
jgi:hypothetical protein